MYVYMYAYRHVSMDVCVKHVRMYLGAYVFFLNHADVHSTSIFIEPVSLT